MNIKEKLFGNTNKGETVYCYEMENKQGAKVSILNYGARILSICVPDREGNLTEVCLGYDNVADYEKDDCWFGAIAGRCANRIANGRFVLNNQEYILAQNNGKNHLHGGVEGFSAQIWEAIVEEDKVRMIYRSLDGEEGYPGNLVVQVAYKWTDDNELYITYHAVSDQDTIINLTNHSYFNLEGADSDSILEHELWLNSEFITEIDEDFIPNGYHLKVDDTPFDFRNGKCIGKEIDADHEQLKIAQGYDHNYILKRGGFQKIAALYAPKTGIGMECYSDQIGIQLYTGNATNAKGRNGKVYGKRSGVCLETQDFPNAINTQNFPTVIRRMGEVYQTKTSYKFNTEII